MFKTNDPEIGKEARNLTELLKLEKKKEKKPILDPKKMFDNNVKNVKKVKKVKKVKGKKY